MNFWQQYYLQPQSTAFQIIDWVNRYFWLILLSVLILVLAFPLWQFSQQWQFSHQWQQRFAENEQQLTQQNRLYQVLFEKQQQQALNDQHLTQINRQIQQILQAQQAEIESVQWNVEEQRIGLTANHRTTPIFKALYALAKEPNIAFEELTLTKLNQDRRIQLNATLFIQREK